ncbi:hypothetical protein C9J03_01550 [Photobacterium gaetbulicola]|nr:hypothetical protein C9J03_01550 [Photobacterium gaetbulicola]
MGFVFCHQKSQGLGDFWFKRLLFVKKTKEIAISIDMRCNSHLFFITIKKDFYIQLMFLQYWHA